MYEYAPYVTTLRISVGDWKMFKRLDNQSYKWDVLYRIYIIDVVYINV